MKFNRIFNGGKIRQLYWIITNDCNLKCKFCIREISNISNKKFLQLSDIEMLIPQVKSFLPNVNMIISGGEPLLHPNFILILKKMKQHFKKVYLVSNGTLPHYFKAHSNIFLGIKIQISIDGTKNNHDKIRGKGAFDKTIDSIKFLLSNKNTVTVASTVSTENISSMFELYKIIKELGVKRWKVSREIPGGDAFQRAQIHISALRWNKFVDDLKKYTSEWEGKLIIKKAFSFVGKKLDMSGITHKQLNLLGCQAGINKIYIYPDLKVIGCPMLKSITLIDLKKRRIDEIEVTNSFQRLLNLNFNDNSKCISCEYIEICRGGCIGVSLLKSDKLTAGDPNCPRIDKALHNKVE